MVRHYFIQVIADVPAVGQVDVDYLHKQALIIAQESGDRRGEGTHLANLAMRIQPLGRWSKPNNYRNKCYSPLRRSSRQTRKAPPIARFTSKVSLFTMIDGVHPHQAVVFGSAISQNWHFLRPVRSDPNRLTAVASLTSQNYLS
jgi:hypothetical protein